MIPGEKAVSTKKKKKLMLTVIGQINHAYLLVESSTEGEDHNVTSIAILREIINYPMEQVQIKR